MKQFLRIGSIVALVGSIALAVTAPITESCQQISNACVDAGFLVGRTAPKGKKLFRDCVQPILDGKTISGVTIDPAVVADCQARGSQHKKKHH
jgi:hypothetical protein